MIVSIKSNRFAELDSSVNSEVKHLLLLTINLNSSTLTADSSSEISAAGSQNSQPSSRKHWINLTHAVHLRIHSSSCITSYIVTQSEAIGLLIAVPENCLMSPGRNKQCLLSEIDWLFRWAQTSQYLQASCCITQHKMILIYVELSHLCTKAIIITFRMLKVRKNSHILPIHV